MTSFRLLERQRVIAKENRNDAITNQVISLSSNENNNNHSSEGSTPTIKKRDHTNEDNLTSSTSKKLVGPSPVFGVNKKQRKKYINSTGIDNPLESTQFSSGENKERNNESDTPVLREHTLADGETSNSPVKQTADPQKRIRKKLKQPLVAGVMVDDGTSDLETEEEEDEKCESVQTSTPPCFLRGHYLLHWKRFV